MSALFLAPLSACLPTMSDALFNTCVSACVCVRVWKIDGKYKTEAVCVIYAISTLLSISN